MLELIKEFLTIPKLLRDVKAILIEINIRLKHLASSRNRILTPIPNKYIYHCRECKKYFEAEDGFNLKCIYCSGEILKKYLVWGEIKG